MISFPIHSFVNSINGYFFPSKVEKDLPLIEKIKNVANFVFKALIGASLYWINPSLFAIGFIAGIAFDKKMHHTLNKIAHIWQTNSVSTCALLGFAAFLSLPVTLATASILCGGHLGSKLART